MDPKEAEEDDVRGDENPVLVDENPVLADENPNYQTPADVALGNANDFQDAGGVAEYNQDGWSYKNKKLNVPKFKFGNAMNDFQEAEEYNQDGSYKQLNVPKFGKKLLKIKVDQERKAIKKGARKKGAILLADDDLIYTNVIPEVSPPRLFSEVAGPAHPPSEVAAAQVKAGDEENILVDNAVSPPPPMDDIAGAAQVMVNNEEGIIREIVAGPAQVMVNNEEDIIREIIASKMNGCDELQLVIEKKLTNTDIAVHQHNLALPVESVDKDFWEFFSSEEKQTLRSENVKHRKLRATLLIVNNKDPQQQPQTVSKPDEVEEINITKYDKKYVLNGKGWHSFLTENDLKRNDLLQVWAFRKEGALGFTLVMK